MTVRSPTLREVRSVVRPSRPGDGQPCGQALQVPEECPGVLGGWGISSSSADFHTSGRGHLSLYQTPVSRESTVGQHSPGQPVASSRFSD